MHTVNKMGWFTKGTAQIPCRKYTFLWCFRLDSSLIFIFALRPEYTNFRRICIFLSSCPWERISRPWIPVMGTTYEKQGVRYLLLLSEIVFYGCGHEFPTLGVRCCDQLQLPLHSYSLFSFGQVNFDVTFQIGF